MADTHKLLHTAEILYPRISSSTAPVYLMFFLLSSLILKSFSRVTAFISDKVWMANSVFLNSYAVTFFYFQEDRQT